MNFQSRLVQRLLFVLLLRKYTKGLSEFHHTQIVTKIIHEHYNNWTIYVKIFKRVLTFSWRSSVPYRNQSIDLWSKLINWFLYHRDLRHERVKNVTSIWLSFGILELRKITSHFEIVTRKFLQKLFFQVTNSTSSNIEFHFELLTQWVNFYFDTFELLTRGWK